MLGSDPRVWQQAFARQAQADLRAEETLRARGDLPSCESLHLLQMACEKLGKAYRCRGGTAPSEVIKSHAFVAKVLPEILIDYASLAPGDALLEDWRMGAVRDLAEEIEVLAPAERRGGTRPDNCEYPWLDDSGAVRVPCDEAFVRIEELPGRVGPLVYKVLKVAATDLAQ